MNKLSKYPLFLLFSALASCSSSDDTMPTSHPVVPHPGDALEVTVSACDFVTDGAPDTRATDNGKTTTFENDDCVGIIILDKSNEFIYQNIPYKYNRSSQTWGIASTEKGACYYDPEARTYIVYYPYSPIADDCKSKDDLQAKFKPQADQSSKDAYRASDLMVYTTTSDAPLKSLKAELKHVYASISLAPTTTGAKYVLEDGKSYDGSYVPGDVDISDVNLTVGNDIYILYRTADGSIRCILPTGIASGKIRCFYTIGSNTYSNEINIPQTDSNKRYTSSTKIENVIYSLENAHVGDFYCINDKKEGYLIPGDVTTLTEEQQKACIGIVYCIDTERIGEAAKEVLRKNSVTPHGLVMALTNASEQGQWGESEKDENGNGGTGPFQNNTKTLKMQYRNINGYAETHWILDNYGSNVNALQNTYSAFYNASRYGTVDSSTAKYTAPNTTTGWFIPSMGQWWDILSNLGGVELKDYQEYIDSNKSISGAAQTAVDNMNKYLGKINSATKFNLITFFWSSSEYSNLYACIVNFYHNGNLNLCYQSKDDCAGKVRCVFAF